MQTVCSPLNHLQAHPALEWIDDRAMAVPTLAVLYHHSEEVTRSDAKQGVREHPFAYGQLYVGVSHIGNHSNILVLMLDDHLHHSCAMTNNIATRNCCHPRSVVAQHATRQVGERART